MQEGQSHYDTLHSISHQNLHGVVADLITPFDVPKKVEMDQWVHRVFLLLQKIALNGEYRASFIVYNASNPLCATSADGVTIQDSCPAGWVQWYTKMLASIEHLNNNARHMAQKRLFKMAFEATNRFENHWNVNSDVRCYAVNMTTHISLMFEWEEPNTKRAKK